MEGNGGATSAPQKKRSRIYPPAPTGKKKAGIGKPFAAAKRIVKKISDDPRAAFFLRPVDELNDGAPNYSAIVTKPMDLSSIITYIEYAAYATLEEVVEDVEQVWENCRLYNRNAAWGTLGRVVFIWADLLQQEFEEEWKKEPLVPKPASMMARGGGNWLAERRQIQKLAATLTAAEAHAFLCLVEAGSPDACAARKLGNCATRCEVDVLQLSNTTANACLRSGRSF
eukprot:gene5708-8712_t